MSLRIWQMLAGLVLGACAIVGGSFALAHSKAGAGIPLLVVGLSVVASLGMLGVQEFKGRLSVSPQAQILALFSVLDLLLIASLGIGIQRRNPVLVLCGFVGIGIAIVVANRLYVAKRSRIKQQRRARQEDVGPDSGHE